jgi:hypothetical protein
MRTLGTIGKEPRKGYTRHIYPHLQGRGEVKYKSRFRSGQAGGALWGAWSRSCREGYQTMGYELLEIESVL